MNWKIFFKNLKEEKIRNFKSPAFLVKPINRSKTQYIFKNTFVFSKIENNFYVTDNNFERFISKDNFISFNYVNITDRDSKFKLDIKLNDGSSKTIKANSNDNILIYYTKNDEVYFFFNFKIEFILNFNEIYEMYLSGTKNKLIEIDYVKEYLESVDINIFSFTESLLKTINDKLDNFYTFDDYNFMNYILSHKKSIIENYLDFNKPVLLDVFLEMKGSYKDLELIKKTGLFEKIIFKDENTKYTNFINYFLNIIPEDYNQVIKVFLKNYNLYQKFKENFKCVIKPTESFYKADWQNIRVGNCLYYNVSGKWEKGLYFVNEIIDNSKVKFKVNNIYLDKLIKRYIEIVNDVKGYLDYLKKIKTMDFEQAKLVIDNNPKVKINNNNTFLIPGYEINISDIKLESIEKDCYLDYAVRVNLDEEDMDIFNKKLTVFKNIIKERMPFFLRTYLEYLEYGLESTYNYNEKIDESNEIEIDTSNFEVVDFAKLKDENTFEIQSEIKETYDNLDEILSFRLEGKSDTNVKILGTGIIDKNNFKVMGYVYNNDKLILKGATSDDVLPYDKLRVGRYCFYEDKVADVYVTSDYPISDKYKNNKNLVKCRYDDLYEIYKNKVIQITNNYFKYIKNTENIKTFNELKKLKLKPGIYTISGNWHEIPNYVEGNWKVTGEGIVVNNSAYVVDIKEQIFKGKPNNKVIAREYIKL